MGEEGVPAAARQPRAVEGRSLLAVRAQEPARKMVEREAGLRSAFGVEASASFLKTLSSEANLLDALNIHCGIIDELHAHQSRNINGASRRRLNMPEEERPRSSPAASPQPFLADWAPKLDKPFDLNRRVGYCRLISTPNGAILLSPRKSRLLSLVHGGDLTRRPR
jgi:hypothetical protein